MCKPLCALIAIGLLSFPTYAGFLQLSVPPLEIDGLYLTTIDIVDQQPSQFNYWAVATARFELFSPTDVFYQAFTGSPQAELSPPLPSAATANPSLAWDTFLTATGAYPNTLNDDEHAPPIAYVPGFSFLTSDDRLIDVTWSGPPNPGTPAGEYVIARFTIASTDSRPLTLTPIGEPVARLQGQSLKVLVESPLNLFTEFYRLPEPGTLALLACVVILRRTRCELRR